MLGFRFRSTSGFAGTAPRLAEGRPFRTPFSVATGRADPPGEAVVTVFVVDSGPPSAKRPPSISSFCSVSIGVVMRSTRSAAVAADAVASVCASAGTANIHQDAVNGSHRPPFKFSFMVVSIHSGPSAWPKRTAYRRPQRWPGSPPWRCAWRACRRFGPDRRLPPPPAACCLLPAASTRSGGTVAPDRRRRAAGTGRLPAWLSLAAPRTPGRWWCRGRTACRRRRRCGPRRWPAGGRCAPLGRWRAAGRWRCWPHARCSR